jgi:hypothetical protein
VFKKSLLILTTLLIGAVVGVLVFIIASRGTTHQQLVGGQPLSYWLLCLEADQASLRADAEATLPQFGSAAIGPLIERLDSPQHGTGESALTALTMIGPSAIPQLTASLHSGSAARKIAAIKLLRSFGPSAGPAVPDIAVLLDDPLVGTTAADYFVQVGAGTEAVAAATKILTGTDQRRRLDAIRVLAEAPNDPHTAPALVNALNTSDVAVSGAAYAAICDLPVTPPAAINAMIQRMGNLETRSAACAALMKAGSNAIEPLSHQAENVDEAVRLDAINLIRLLILGTSGQGETEPLERFLADGSVKVRTSARRAISEVREAQGRPHTGMPRDLLSVNATPVNTGPVMPEISTLHLDPTIVPASRPTAASLNTPAVVAAIEQLDDANDAVREQAAAVVKKAWPLNAELPDYNRTIDPAEKLKRVRLLSFTKDWRKYDLMISAANQEDPVLRHAAIFAMGRSLQSPRILEKLVDLARHGNTTATRHDAIVALSPAGKDPRVTPVLRNAMSDPDPNIAAAAQKALESPTAPAR